jgi:hypothetical protein
MAERRADNWVPMRYPFKMASMDRANHPSSVQFGSLTRAIGLDGRFKGSARSFPGFTKVLDLKAPPFDGSDWRTLGSGNPDTDPYYYNLPINNSGLTAVWFFKYLTVQIPTFTNLTTAHQTRTIRGFAVAHDYTDSGQKGVFRYYFYDPVLSRWSYHNLLQIVAGLDTYEYDAIKADSSGTNPHWPWVTTYYVDSTLMQATTSYDVGSSGPFIFFTVVPPETVGGNGVHRSIYCRGLGLAKLNGTGTQGHKFGPNTHSFWGPTPIGAPDSFITNGGAGETVTGLVTSPQPSDIMKVDKTETDSTAMTGLITAGIRLKYDAKNVEGPIQQYLVTSAIAKQNEWVIGVGEYEKVTQGGTIYRRRRLPSWMLDLRKRSYRTLDAGLFASGIDIATLASAVAGVAFREDSEKSLFFSDVDHDVELPIEAAGTDNGLLGAAKVFAGADADNILVNQAQYNAFDDVVEFFPKKIKLLLPYQGTMLRVGTVPFPEGTETISDRDEVLSWGALNKYAPEQCRIADSTPLGSSQDEKALSLVTAGDYAFAVGDTSVFRMHRNGNLLAINEVQTLSGGVGRFGAVGVGTALWYMAPNGVYMVDGASGEYQLISALDRVVQDDWKASLTAVHMGYDMLLGAVLLLNTTEEEMILLWNNTGAITQLNNVPFKFLTYGVDPKNADLNKSWTITNSGIVYSPNATRSTANYDGTPQGAFTMCGGDPTALWNAVVTTGSTSSAIKVTVPSGEFLDPGAIGQKLHVLTGAQSYNARTISSVSYPSANQTYTFISTSVTAASGTPFSAVLAGDVIKIVIPGKTDQWRIIATASSTVLTWTSALTNVPSGAQDDFVVYHNAITTDTLANVVVEMTEGWNYTAGSQVVVDLTSIKRGETTTPLSDVDPALLTDVTSKLINSDVSNGEILTTAGPQDFLRVEVPLLRNMLDGTPSNNTEIVLDYDTTGATSVSVVAYSSDTAVNGAAQTVALSVGAGLSTTVTLTDATIGNLAPGTLQEVWRVRLYFTATITVRRIRVRLSASGLGQDGTPTDARPLLTDGNTAVTAVPVDITPSAATTVGKFTWDSGRYGLVSTDKVKVFTVHAGTNYFADMYPYSTTIGPSGVETIQRPNARIRNTVTASQYWDFVLTKDFISLLQDTVGWSVRMVWATRDYNITEAEAELCDYYLDQNRTTLTTRVGTPFSSVQAGDIVVFFAADASMSVARTITGFTGTTITWSGGLTQDGELKVGDQFVIVRAADTVTGDAGGTTAIINVTPALSGAPASGDRIAIAPIGVELIGWPLYGAQDGPDVFMRKIVRAMGHQANLIAGDITAGTNSNLFIDHQLYQRSDIDTVVAGPNPRAIEADQTKNFTRINYAGTVLYPSWRCMASNLYFEVMEGIVHVTLSRSEAETVPVGPG